jgi:acyl-phosphate glycerol 3-phosphate acyltransferase
MTAPILIAIAIFGGYLLGAIPAGYLIGKARGVDLLNEGSKNIGATNAGRVMGFWWGVLVFVIDAGKGALPVALAFLLPEPEDVKLWPNTLSVIAGIAAFVGHLFPVYLGFRGGKGVATGCGVIAVLVPQLTGIVLAIWAVVLLATRYMSVASLTAVVLVIVLRLLWWSAPRSPFSAEEIVITLFCLTGSLLVILTHIPNIHRLILGTENRL